MFGIFGNNKTLYPIGIDLGSDSLRMVQIGQTHGQLFLMASGRMEVPPECRQDIATRQKWLIAAIRELLTVKSFKGRKVCLALPARDVFIEHVRLNCASSQVDEKLHQEAQGRLPFPSQHGIIRHCVVGEVCDSGDARKEVIMMAVPKRSFEFYMGILDKCKLETDKINLEAHGLMSGFSPLIEKASLKDSAYFVIDLGYSSTRVLGLHGDQMTFMRKIEIGAGQVAEAKRSDKDGPTSQSFMEAGSGPATATALAPAVKNSHLKAVFNRLREEIQHCIWYHDTICAHNPLKKLIFLGGMACHTSFCQALAQGLGLPAQLADPISQVAPDSLIGPHSDIIRTTGNYDWSLAFGLSLNRNTDLGDEQ